MIARPLRFLSCLLLSGLAGCGRDRAPDINPPSGTALHTTTAADSAIDDDDSLNATVPVFEFAEAGGEGVIPVLAPPSETVADLNEGAVLLGGLGPVVFVRTWVWANSCGAHGNTSAAFATIDLARGAAFTLLPDSERAAIEEAFRARASAALAAADSAADDSVEAGTVIEGSVFNPDSNALTMIVPDLSQGRLALRYQFTADACYACSDGAWSGYTRSVRLPAAEIPPSLRSLAEVPAEVQAFLRADRPDSAVGWSLIAMPGATRDALARLFGVTASAGGSEFLVWRNTAAGFETVWLRGRGAEATVVGRRPGVWIVAGRKAWTWRERPVSIRTVPCTEQP